MTPENPVGIDALRKESFSKIAVPQPRAFERLTGHTKRIARRNYWFHYNGTKPINHQDSRDQDLLNRGDSFVEQNVNPGGQYFQESERLEPFYHIPHTFKRIITGPFEELAEEYYGQQSPQDFPDPTILDGNFYISSALDFCALIDDSNGFNSGLIIVAESLNETLKPREVRILLSSAANEDIEHLSQRMRQVEPADASTVTLFEHEREEVDPDTLRIDRDALIDLRNIYFGLLDDNGQRDFLNV